MSKTVMKDDGIIYDKQLFIEYLDNRLDFLKDDKAHTEVVQQLLKRFNAEQVILTHNEHCWIDYDLDDCMDFRDYLCGSLKKDDAEYNMVRKCQKIMNGILKRCPDCKAGVEPCDLILDVIELGSSDERKAYIENREEGLRNFIKNRFDDKFDTGVTNDYTLYELKQLAKQFDEQDGKREGFEDIWNSCLSSHKLKLLALPNNKYFGEFLSELAEQMQLAVFTRWDSVQPLEQSNLAALKKKDRDYILHCKDESDTTEQILNQCKKETEQIFLTKGQWHWLYTKLRFDKEFWLRNVTGKIRIENKDCQAANKSQLSKVQTCLQIMEQSQDKKAIGIVNFVNDVINHGKRRRAKMPKRSAASERKKYLVNREDGLRSFIMSRLNDDNFTDKHGPEEIEEMARAFDEQKGADFDEIFLSCLDKYTNENGISSMEDQLKRWNGEDVM
jgi:hypothetical protein